MHEIAKLKAPYLQPSTIGYLVPKVRDKEIVNCHLADAWCPMRPHKPTGVHKVPHLSSWKGKRQDMNRRICGVNDS